ncbi:hypothetical protein Pth03_53910 [Planotetraspora thailandica]|uniref:Uncharacterized protein n=1 Tax=Planotetraspora thailandica TaxID=487172 RepID=A0A8J3V405_9ACTN|nr:hypothetical protein [Planotetraspora thailandica]GII57002.1 hypothetical protein Pth03_53910 [Planotetraspora thailandica]
MSEIDPLDGVDELSIETPEADAVEQHRPLRGSQEDPWPEHVPFDADPADVTEQGRSVDLGDDEEYR